MGVNEIYFKSKSSGFLSFLLALIMWLIDFLIPGLAFPGLKLSTFFSFNFLRFITSWGLIIVGVFLYLFVLPRIAFFRDHKGYGLYFLVIFSFFFLWSYGGHKGLIHLIIPIFIMLTLPDSYMDSEKKTITLILLWFFDFILTGLINDFMPSDFAEVFGNNLVFPVWLIFTSIWANQISPNLIYVGSIIFFTFLAIFSLYSGTYFYNQAKDRSENFKGFGQIIYKATQNAISFFNEVIIGGITDIRQLFNISQGSIPGQEQQSENPQGVFLKEIKAGDYIYRENIPIYVSAILEARKIDKPFDVKVQCYTEKINDIGKKEQVFGYINKKGQTEKTFKIINGAETTFQCIFDGDALPYGSYSITINASFNFSTEAYKKIYLMDRERMLNDYKLLNDKGIEPSKQAILEFYGIKDGDFPSIYTTGPVSLAIGTENSPWDIGDEKINPRFGIKIENKWQEGGRLSKLNTIYLKIPENFNILENSCTGIAVDSIEQTTEESEKGMKTYKVPVSDLLDITNIETFLNYICLMEIDKNVLDETQITTRYLKAKIEYDYELIEKININIEKQPEIEIEDSLENEV